MTGYQPETWAYAGVRIDSKGKRIHAWRDPAGGKLRLWPDRGSFVIGGLYEVKIDRRDDGMYRSGSPVYAGGRYEDTAEVTRWQVESEAAERRLRSEAAERKAKKDGGPVDEACRPLCELARGLHNFEDVDRLVNSVRRRIYDAWGEK